MNGVCISALGFLVFTVVQLDPVSSMSGKTPSLNSTNNTSFTSPPSQEQNHLVLTPSLRIFQEAQSSITTRDASQAGQVQYHLVVTQSSKSTSELLGLKSIQPCTTTMEPEEMKTTANLLSGNVIRDMISSTVSASQESKPRSKYVAMQKESAFLETKYKRSPGNKRSRKKRSKDDEKCPRTCTCKSCSNDVKGIAMNCKTDDLKKFLRELKISKRNVCSLNFSNNNLSSLKMKSFKGFTNLHYLNLDGNRLTKLMVKTFQGLHKLRYLSLRYNNLSKWNGNLYNDTPQLSILNLQGNSHLKLRNTLLENTTLQSIVGVTTSPSCIQCNMTRQNNTSLQDIFSIKNWPDGCVYIPERHQHELKDLLKKSLVFQGVCSKGNKCNMVFTKRTLIKILFVDKCKEVISSLRPIIITLGIVALVSNIVVVMVIVTTKSLRSKTAFLLITHMSFCDILIGIYAIAVGHGHGSYSDGVSEFVQWRKNTCPYFRTVFVLGQIMEVVTSLLLTTERYLAIVYCMYPLIRLTKRHASVVLVVFWMFAAFMCFMHQYYDAGIITDNAMCVLVRLVDLHETGLFFSQGIMIILVVMYFITMIQYCHIYIVARKSSQNMGLRPEASLAYRISLMVISSFVFLAVPNLALFIVSAMSTTFIGQPQQIILYKWLPQALLVLNACLNPLLLAYRNDKFVSALRQHKTLLSQSLHGVIAHSSHQNPGFELKEQSPCASKITKIANIEETKM